MEKCPHIQVIKTVGRHADGPYRGMQFDIWNCFNCGHDFYPRRRRFRDWRNDRTFRKLVKILEQEGPQEGSP